MVLKSIRAAIRNKTTRISVQVIWQTTPYVFVTFNQRVRASAVAIGRQSAGVSPYGQVWLSLSISVPSLISNE